MRVLIFGDSITHGGWDAEHGGWPGRLRRGYDLKTLASGLKSQWPSVFNLGITGETSEGLLKRIEVEATAREYPNEEQFFVIETGLNDTIVDDNGEWSNPNQFVQNLKEISLLIARRKSKVLFIGLTCVDEEHTTPIVGSDITYSNDRIDVFNSALVNFCEETMQPLADIHDAFVAQNKKDKLLADGLHPNARGHELMYHLIKPRFDALLESPEIA